MYENISNSDNSFLAANCLRINDQYLGEGIQQIGHFDNEAFSNSIPVSDLPYKEIILKNILHMNEWAISFLSNKHKKLGRSGPVCPFVPLSIKRKLFFITYYLCGEGTTVDDVKDIMVGYKTYFQQTQTAECTHSTYHSLMVVFISTDNQSKQVINLIEESQASLKPKFIKDNTMIGQFFDGCDVQGIHNKTFRPFESPVPAIAIRKFMPQDLVFVTDTVENIQLYIKEFNITSRESLMALLKTLCLDKNQSVLAHAEILLNHL